MQELAKLAAHLSTAHDSQSVIGFVTHTAREIVGAHAAVTKLTTDRPEKSSAISVSWSDKYPHWREIQTRFGNSQLDQLVCGTNRSQRLDQQALELLPEFRTLLDTQPPYPPMRGWLAGAA